MVAGVLGYLGGMGRATRSLPLLAGDGVPIAWTPSLAGAAVAIALARRLASPRCTRRCTPAGSTPPSPCGRSESGPATEAAHHRLQRPAPPQGTRRVPRRRASHRRGTVVALLALTQAMTGDQRQPAELRRQHRRHAAQQRRLAELRRHRRRAVSPMAREPPRGGPRAHRRDPGARRHRRDLATARRRGDGEGPPRPAHGRRTRERVQAQDAGGRSMPGGRRPTATSSSPARRRPGAEPADGRLRAHRQAGASPSPAFLRETGSQDDQPAHHRPARRAGESSASRAR